MSIITPQKLHLDYQTRLAALQIPSREQAALNRLNAVPANNSRWLRAFCNLLSDERPFYSPLFYGKDKFSGLVGLVGEPAPFGWVHDEAADHLQRYGLSCVRRWANETSRPSGFFLAHFVPDLQDAALRISDRLIEEAALHSTLPKRDYADSRYETGGM